MAVKIFDLIVAILIGSMVMGGLSAYFIDFNRNYKTNLSDSQFETFNKIANITGLSEEQGTTIVGGELDKEAESTVSLFAATFNAVKRFLTSTANIATVGESMVNDVDNVLTRLGISTIFKFGLLALITVIIIFGVIVAFLKVRP